MALLNWLPVGKVGTDFSDLTPVTVNNNKYGETNKQ
jgi:hypothetical protein